MMVQKDARTIQAELSKPFAPEDLEWRLQQTEETGRWGIAVPYVTNRAIQARLDDVVGPENWCNEYRPWHSAGKKEAQLCGISICFPERGFITKWDGAEDSDIEPVKGGLSDSMKRAAVQWGIGRCLYSMDTVFVDVEKRGRSWVIKPSERAKLDNAYRKMLDKLGLTPARAGGMQSTLTSQQTGGAPAPSAGNQKNAPQLAPSGRQGQPQPQPAPALTVLSPEYTVLSARPQQCTNGVHTLAALQGKDGKQIPAFTVGLHPELVEGTQLADVKLDLQKQGNVVFYILREYKIVPPQSQAA